MSVPAARAWRAPPLSALWVVVGTAAQAQGGVWACLAHLLWQWPVVRPIRAGGGGVVHSIACVPAAWGGGGQVARGCKGTDVRLAKPVV